jgi:transposase
MMGSKHREFAPLVNVSLEQLVPADHFYRHLHKSLDLSFVRDLVAPFYATGGRPSVDPVVFFKLQLIMFFEGIRSERQLVRTAADRLSLRWYLGYDLHEELPDHSSLTRIRDRYGVDTFRRFFERIVEQCQKAGLVWGKELYFEGTQVEANADDDAMLPRFYLEATHAHLAALFPDQADDQYDDQYDQTRNNSEPAEPGTNLLSLTSKLPQATQAEGEQVPAAEPPGQEQGKDRGLERSGDWISRLGRPSSREKNSWYQRIADLRVSTTDPDATLMHKKGGGGAHLGYHTHYAVDGGKARIILQALVTPSEVQDNQPMLDLLWRVCFRWRLRPKQVTGDTKYGTIENIVAVEQQGIRAYVPLPNWEYKTGYLGSNHVTYDPQRDVYICPQGQPLRRRTNEYTSRKVEYRARAEDCNACSLKAQCTPSNQGRIVHRQFDEEYLDRVRAYHKTAAYEKAIGKRRVWVEPLFGEAKQWHGLDRFRLRGLEKVNIESLLIAAG